MEYVAQGQGPRNVSETEAEPLLDRRGLTKTDDSRGGRLHRRLSSDLIVLPLKNRTRVGPDIPSKSLSPGRTGNYINRAMPAVLVRTAYGLAAPDVARYITPRAG